MHSTIGKQVTFIHNGDFSGDIEVVNRTTGLRINIPEEDWKLLYNEKLKEDMIRLTERMLENL